MVQAGLELPEVFLYPESWDYRLKPHTWFNIVLVVLEKRLKMVGWARCGPGKAREKDARHNENVPHGCCIFVSILAMILQLAISNGHWARGTQHLSAFFSLLFSSLSPSLLPLLLSPLLFSFSLLPLPILLFPSYWGLNPGFRMCDGKAPYH